MEQSFKHVGTVEILRTRTYPLDPYADRQFATEVIVQPDTYPLLYDGLSYVWLMGGVLNGQWLKRGDGLFLANPNVSDILTNIHVTFPSRLYGPDDWEELLRSPSCREGNPEQRIRIKVL